MLNGESLIRWAVPVAGIDPARVTFDQLHGVACTWLDDDTDHRQPRSKPWSVRPITIIDGITIVEVSTLTGAAERVLHDRVQRGKPLRFGSQQGSIVAAPYPIVKLTWDAILRAPSSEAWSIAFLTPTSFSKGRNKFSPWPDPMSLAWSMMTQWNAVCPSPDVELRVERRKLAAIWVSDVDGRNEIISVKSLTVSGFRGRIRYVCDDPAIAPVFSALLNLATFAGVGRYATHGLGTIALEPTWSPVDRDRR